ncbi:MAG: FMN-binding protein [Treponema sp.]|jgi:uncharacterized protein with FMN-binding domain|nr:FMN-binding protein [Treponema sp.]
MRKYIRLVRQPGWLSNSLAVFQAFSLRTGSLAKPRFLMEIVRKLKFSNSYIVLIVCVAMILAACLSFKNIAVYEPGLWEGSGEGYNGTILLTVETDSASIIDINILEQHEDEMIGGEAIANLKGFILETSSTDIDAVSGATQSSEGFLKAVNDAMAKARIEK